MKSLGLLCARDDGELTARIAREPYAALWRRLVSRWEGLAARADVRAGTFRQANLGLAACTPRVIDAALIHRLTAREDALAYVVQCVDRLTARYADAHTPDELRGRTGRASGPVVLSHGEVALAADLVRESLPPETRAGLGRIMRECIIGFTGFEGTLGGYGSGANIPCCRDINAGIAALTWGEECGYREWKPVVWKASEVARQYLHHGCDAGGFSYEGTGYGHSMFLYIYLYAQLLRQSGVRDLFAEEPLLERIPEASQHMLLDDHSFAATTNDHGLLEPWSMWWLLLTAQHYRRPDHLGLWHAFQGPDHPVRPYGDVWPWYAEQAGVVGRDEEKPDPSLLAAFLWWDATAPVEPIERSRLPLAQCAEGTGTATFRTGWTPGGVFAAFLGGGRSHTCFGHAHLDCGHFGISAYGRYLAVDTGRYNFHENQHSVVMVEGRERHPDYPEGKGMASDMLGGRLCDFERGAFVDYCKADAAQMKNCTWADRHFLFVRTPGGGAYVVTLDNILTPSPDPSTFCWQMQVHPKATIALAGDRQARVTDGGARLDIDFFMKDNLFAPGAEPRFALSQDVQEWVWPYGRSEDASLFERTGLLVSSLRRPRLLARQTSVSCFLGAVISPRRTEAPPRRVRTWNRANLVGLVVEDEACTDTLLIALDHAYIDTPEYYGLCELALVRRTPDSPAPAVWTKGGAVLTIRQTGANQLEQFHKGCPPPL